MSEISAKNTAFPNGWTLCEVQTHVWRIPNFLKAEKNLFSDSFVIYGVKWMLSFVEGGQGAWIQLMRHSTYDHVAMGIRWMVNLGGASEAIKPCEDFNDSRNPTIIGFTCAFELPKLWRESCKPYIDADDSLSLTLVLQRVRPVARSEPHNALGFHTLGRDVAAQLHESATSDLKIRCAKAASNTIAVNAAAVIINTTPNDVKSKSPVLSLEDEAGDKDLEYVGANRFVLAARSPVIRCMLYGPLKGKEQLDGVWDLSSYSHGVVTALVHHCYGVHEVQCMAHLSDGRNVLALFELAMRLQLIELAQHCASSFLIKNKDVMTAAMALAVAKPFILAMAPDSIDKKTDKESALSSLGTVGSRVSAPWRKDGTIYYPGIVVAMVENQAEPTVVVFYLDESSCKCEVPVSRLCPPSATINLETTKICKQRSLLQQQQDVCARSLDESARKFLAQNIDAVALHLTSL